MSKGSRYIFIFLSMMGGVLSSCDTSSTIEDPNQDHFIKYYGGDGDQEGVDAVVGPDGSLYMLGNTTAPGTTVGKQLYLVKADPEGILIWSKTFGGQFDEDAKDLELTVDGKLVILANSQKGSTENDILLMTLSLDGTKIDSALVGLQTITNEEADDVASSISLTSDGFIISGSTTGVRTKGFSVGIQPDDLKDVLHLRFSNDLTLFSEGNWTRTNGTNGIDGGVKVYEVNASLYYVFGYTNINAGTGATTSDFNFWVFSLGPTGIGNKSQMFPGALTNDVLTTVITPAPGSTDGFLLAGSSEDANGNFDIYINKLRKDITFNPAVDYQLNKPLSLDLGKTARANVVAFTSISTGYLLLTNERTTTSNNFLLTKINQDGLPAWSNPESLIFGGQKDDFIGSVLELPDGRILLIGTMALGDEGQKKMALIKVNKDGKFLN